MANRITLAEDRHREKLLGYAREKLRREPFVSPRDKDARRKLNRVCCSLAGSYKLLPIEDLWVVLQEWIWRSPEPWPLETARQVLSSAARWIRNQKDTAI